MLKLATFQIHETGMSMHRLSAAWCRPGANKVRAHTLRLANSMKSRNCARGFIISALVGTATIIASATGWAQISTPRTWPELKEATQARVDGQRYPLAGYDRSEVREILDRIGSLDRDEWARSWMVNAQRHMSEAQRVEHTDEAKAAEEYLAGWRYYAFGAWPTANSPEKEKSGKRGFDAFRHFARLTSPAIEVLRVPFEGKEIIGYLQKPAGVAKPPVVIALGGADSYKEYVVDRYGPSYLKAGLAYVALDLPAKGESKLLVWEPGSERIYSRVIDALQQRMDIDTANIGFVGVSAGGHWAVRAAFAEPKRLKATVNWGGPVDLYFTKEWQVKQLGTREYLFDLFAVRAEFYGAKTLDEFLDAGPKMSMKEQLNKPAAPMLVVNGQLDSQVPIDDTYVMLRTGQPKEAWINPTGAHLGRTAEWPDNRILNEVVIPYLQRKLF